jgi:hypothetical protein
VKGRPQVLHNFSGSGFLTLPTSTPTDERFQCAATLLASPRMLEPSQSRAVFSGFLLNTASHALLIAAAWLVTELFETVRQGSWGGWSTSSWIAAGLALPILHQSLYTVGFLSLWAIAIAYRSQAALLLAAYNHVSIWVHHFALERPDMREIYDEV